MPTGASRSAAPRPKPSRRCGRAARSNHSTSCHKKGSNVVQNIHAHVWDQALHMTPETIKETDVSRGFRLDLTTKFDVFMKDCEVFDRVAVFGMKARKNGYWVPDDYVADFVKRAGGKL